MMKLGGQVHCTNNLAVVRILGAQTPPRVPTPQNVFSESKRKSKQSISRVSHCASVNKHSRVVQRLRRWENQRMLSSFTFLTFFLNWTLFCLLQSPAQCFGIWWTFLSRF